MIPSKTIVTFYTEKEQILIPIGEDGHAGATIVCKTTGEVLEAGRLMEAQGFGKYPFQEVDVIV